MVVASIALEEARRRGVCRLCQASLPMWKHVPVDHMKLRINPHARVYWCARCGYGSVQPTPSPAEVRELYRFDGYYTHFEPVDVKGRADTFLDRLRVHLAWRLDQGTPLTESHVHKALGGKLSRICDLGCGGGDLVQGLCELGHSVVGVELDSEAASRRFEGQAEMLAGDAESLPKALARQRFDCVILRHVLEHCRDPRHALSNAKSLLAPGGLLMCEVPNNEALGLRGMGCAWAMFDMPRHLHFFTRQSLLRECQLAGLHVRETYFANFHRQFANDWIDAEREIWSKLMGLSHKPAPAPVQNSRFRAWKQLVTSVFLPAAYKYDSVGVLATG